MAEFNLALPKLINWSINQNQYSTSEKDAMAGYVDIPVVDIEPLIQHLQALQFDASKHESRPVWNFEKGQNELFSLKDRRCWILRCRNFLSRSYNSATPSCVPLEE